jgi:hypothetical protein
MGGVRCFLQRELRNLRANLVHASGLLEQRALCLDSCTSGEIVPEWGVPSLWLRGNRQVGMGLGNGAKWEPARVGKRPQPESTEVEPRALV